MPEWIGTILFFVAIGLTATKLNDDFGERGLWGYGMLMVMILVFAAAVAVAFA